MTLNKQKYLIQKPVIAVWLKNKPEWTLQELISYISIATGCPCIITATFIGELQGFTPELIGKIERLCKFYGVTEIV